MEYVKLTESNLNDVISSYIDYYNNCEDGCWTYEKAYKRIHQVMTMEGAECMVQCDKGEIRKSRLQKYIEMSKTI